MAKKKRKSKSPSPAHGKPKKSHAARRRARRTTVTRVTKETRETRSNPAANPPVVADLTQVLLPGFGAFAATKVVQRIVFSLVQRRFPKLGRHAHALSGVAAFAAVWLFAHKIKGLRKYHDGIVMGSGVAALHGVASCYLPKKYNWLLADCRPEDVRPTANGNGVPQVAAAPTAAEGDEFSYLESQLEEMEAGGARGARTVRGPRGNTRPIGSAMNLATAGQNDGAAVDPDLADYLEPGEDVDDLYSGAFAN